MFTLLMIVLSAIIACDDPKTPRLPAYPIYQYTIMREVPDSLKDDMAKWITETVRAANQHMTGGDYEDPEDVIDEAEDVAKNLFARDVEYLSIVADQNASWIHIPAYRLDSIQFQIFEDIR